MIPYCDTHPCQNRASHSYVDFVEIEAPHWWLWLQTDGLWAVVLAVIFAILVGIAIVKLK